MLSYADEWLSMNMSAALFIGRHPSQYPFRHVTSIQPQQYQHVAVAMPSKDSLHFEDAGDVAEIQGGDDAEKEVLFDSFDLDDRLLKGIAQCGFAHCTPIQAKFIPLALAGEDIVARARTGSGKTAAFLIPVLQMLLKQKLTSILHSTRPTCLVISPTRELCRQTSEACKALCVSCSARDVNGLDVAQYDGIDACRPLLSTPTDIVFGTPSRILQLAQSDKEFLSQVKRVVIDEADLVFSFGYHDDILALIKLLPADRQTLLTSATLSSDVKYIKRVLTQQNGRKMCTLRLKDGMLPNAQQLRQFHIKCSEEDKFVMLYSLIKLRLLRGKCIIFVRDTDRCYRLKLFLEQFSIYACVLNAQMPVNSRCHIVQQFNEDVYNYIIASDACELGDDAPPVRSDDEGEEEVVEKPKEKPKKKSKDKDEEEKDDEDEENDGEKKKGKKRRTRKADAESGVGRGIDFARVANVINFDMPSSVHTYIHRVGRTARGWSRGTALTFTDKKVASDDEALEAVREMLIKELGDDVLKPYVFRTEELDGFRYRARDILRAVSSHRVREARLTEIREELLRSRKLEAHFTANPTDASALRHDRSKQHLIKRQMHLKHVPSYIVPAALKGNDYSLPSAGKKNKKKAGGGNKRKAASNTSATPAQNKFAKRQKDPLKNAGCLEE